MATKKELAKKSRDYYKTHKKYREQKKEDRLEYARSHKRQEAEQSRKYYKENPTYRKYKISYAREYRKSHKKRK